MIRVLIADDHKVVRQGLRFLLSSEPGIEVAGEAADGGAALDAIRAMSPDVVLLDLFMPRLDGLGVLDAMSEEGLTAAVLVLTSSPDDQHLVAALKAGALSYLPKTAGVDQVIDAVRAAARGESVLEPAATARLLRELRQAAADPLAQLTPRETDVLKGLAQGRSNREIARVLSVSEETVKSHVSSILAKLGLADRTQAAIFALQRHWSRWTGRLSRDRLLDDRDQVLVLAARGDRLVGVAAARRGLRVAVALGGVPALVPARGADLEVEAGHVGEAQPRRGHVALEHAEDQVKRALKAGGPALLVRRQAPRRTTASRRRKARARTTGRAFPIRRA